ncbi:MAG: DUF1295 domain-containing protein [Hyphomonadaceae bacterium]|nr:DUF1295 domain-containing protein [Hyphomonadaceae bacterium]
MDTILLINLSLSFVLSTALWAVSVRVRDPSFIDAWWALGIVVLAWATFMQAPTPGPHALALAGLATAWGLRLGLYLLRRWRDHGKDRRYEGLERAAAAQGLSFAAFSALWVFAPQMLLQFVVALPVMLGQLSERGVYSALAWWGTALAAFGVAYESIADWQLVRFKSKPANVGKVMDRGLWRYSRHPNYFGDLCVWWGLWLIALDAGAGRFSLLGPTLLTLLLVGVSGAPTTEPHLKRTKPEYEAYKKRTSAFIPWPPRAN